MRRVLILAAALAISLSSSAEAQRPRWPNYVRPSNVPTPPIVNRAIGQAFRPVRQNYWSQSLYGNGSTFTQGYGPFGSYQYNTLYSPGFSYTSGYGVPSYGAPYGGGYGYGGFGGGY